MRLNPKADELFAILSQESSLALATDLRARGTLTAQAGPAIVQEIDTLMGELLMGKRKKDVEEEEDFDDEEEDEDEDDLDEDEDDFDDEEEDEDDFEEEFEDDELDDDDDDIFYDDEEDE